MNTLKWWTQSLPTQLWTGSPLVRERLEVLWEIFVPITAHRRRVSPGDIERTRAIRAWRWARAYKRRIPSPFQVYYVAYPAPITHVERPSSVIIGLNPNEAVDPAALQRRTMEAASSLAAANRTPLPVDTMPHP